MNPSGNCRVNKFSFSSMWWRTVLPPAVFVLAVSVLPQRHHAAAAPETDCETLLEKAAKADEIPEVTIDSATNSVRIRTSEGECVERLSASTAPPAAPGPPEPARAAPRTAPTPLRAAPSVTEVPEPAPAPAIPETAEPGKPFETHPYFRPQPAPPPGPRPLDGSRGETAKAPAPPPAADCAGDLGALWKKGEHDIRGSRYRLSQVFTIDLDGDGRTDNVGFRLKAAKTPDLVIRYFAAPGQPAGRSVPTLRLDDEEVISGLCFARVSFDTPRPKDRETGRAFETPDLAREMMAKGDTARRMKQGLAAGSERGGTGAAGLWAGIAVASVLLLAAGGAGAHLTRRRWLPALKRLAKARQKKGEEGEEEEEKEEEEEEEEEEEDEKEDSRAEDDGAEKK